MKTAALLLVATFVLSSCSMLTRQGRYERYVRKSSLGLHRRQAKIRFRTDTMPRDGVMQPSDWQANAQASSPESVTSSSDTGSP